MKLALFGGPKLNKKSFKYNTVGKEEISSVVDIMKKMSFRFCCSSQSRILWRKAVKKLENEFKRFFNVKYAVAVNSATSALYCMLMSSGVEPGDEVITSPYTMHATASSILQCVESPSLLILKMKHMDWTRIS